MRKLIIIMVGIIISVYSFAQEKKSLVVYFSKTNNTEAIAQIIKDETKSDIFKIEVVNPYPEDYRETTSIAKKEQNEGYLPPLKTKVNNLDSYDTIYLGYPNWWGTMPMAVFAFLKENDLSEKTVIPFSTHLGSQFGRSVNDLVETVPNAKVIRDGYITRDAQSSKTRDEVRDWLKKLGK